MFSVVPTTKHMTLCMLNLLSANALSMDKSNFFLKDWRVTKWQYFRLFWIKSNCRWQFENDSNNKNLSVWESPKVVPRQWSSIYVFLSQLTNVRLFHAEPHSSVGGIADLGTGSHWFDPRLSQYSFRELMIVIATGFIPLSLQTVSPFPIVFSKDLSCRHV